MAGEFRPSTFGRGEQPVRVPDKRRVDPVLERAREAGQTVWGGDARKPEPFDRALNGVIATQFSGAKSRFNPRRADQQLRDFIEAGTKTAAKASRRPRAEVVATIVADYAATPWREREQLLASEEVQALPERQRALLEEAFAELDQRENSTVTEEYVDEDEQAPYYVDEDEQAAWVASRYEGYGEPAPAEAPDDDDAYGEWAGYASA